jgi:transcriptional regulator with XRE-family HTH domain
VFARRVREARKRRGWSQAQLADRLAEIGYTGIGRATVAKIEDATSTRSNASLEDVLAIAAALDCSPLHLIVPLEDDELLQITAGLPPAQAVLIRDWVRSVLIAPLRIVLGVAEQNVDDVAAFMSQLPEPWLRLAAEAMQLTEDQTEDTLWNLSTGENPWPTGRPRSREREDSNDG